MNQPQLKIFSGSSHPSLAQEVADEIGVPLTDIDISRFACGEIYTRAKETVRGDEVFIIQTASANVNEDLMELFIMIDSLKRSFAGSIHVVMPHYAYSRQDRVASAREPISAKLVADLISTSGADHLITMKLHSDQEQGFFNFPVDNLNPNKLFCEYFGNKFSKEELSEIVVVSPDAGGAKDAKVFADILGARLAIIHKARPEHNVSEVTHVVGDVEGKTCILYDDMVDTAGSVVAASKALKEMGAQKMYLAATHAVFSGPAVERLKSSIFEEVVVTNSIPLGEEKHFENLKILSVAPLLAKIIRNVYEGQSVTQLLS